MISDFLPSNLDGNGWEELCQSCYRIRYTNDNYQEIEASHKGDSGIEGFTHSGITFQSYCPEKNYSENELYENIRSKITKDINKLIDKKNIEKQVKWGIKEIKEWHFVTPYARDSRILQHLETKRKLVMDKKAKEPDLYKHISEDFIISLKLADDFMIELTRLLRNRLVNVKLNLALDHTSKVDWSKCNSEKSGNVIRKVKAMMVGSEENDINSMIDFYMSAYLSGIEIFENLRDNFPDIYESILKLKNSYKNTAFMKTKMVKPTNSNLDVFYEIMNEFENKIQENFKGIIDDPSIAELQLDIVSAWLADCTMEFKPRGELDV
ncbi:hypothetical protein FDF97_03385 [Clostridium botulinum]|uniref:Uncharacterized protein n=1 Tax=Clostridium botulinum TaxID=1491 RepID=A0AA43Y4F8_CLOBO|nr:hypothetical protein [Clostridium botulinum]NFI20118.1 hypothetical protein [Clostridium botulinum]NFQ77299.1 hypothetical protein [Clostridium botulinum]